RRPCQAVEQVAAAGQQRQAQADGEGQGEHGRQEQPAARASRGHGGRYPGGKASCGGPGFPRAPPLFPLRGRPPASEMQLCWCLLTCRRPRFRFTLGAPEPLPGVETALLLGPAALTPLELSGCVARRMTTLGERLTHLDREILREAVRRAGERDGV